MLSKLAVVIIFIYICLVIIIKFCKTNVLKSNNPNAIIRVMF